MYHAYFLLITFKWKIEKKSVHMSHAPLDGISCVYICKCAVSSSAHMYIENNQNRLKKHDEKKKCGCENLDEQMIRIYIYVHFFFASIIVSGQT
jgi:hypothetical protein